MHWWPLEGEQVQGLSAAALGRLKAEWAREHAEWQHRSLLRKRYACRRADGIYTNLRAEDDPRICLLVIIGVTAKGQKVPLALRKTLTSDQSGGMARHEEQENRTHWRVYFADPLTTLGKGPRTRTPMSFCASASPKELICRNTPGNT